MDAEQFVKWALDDARTVEERFATELVLEQGVYRWNAKRKIYERDSIEQRMERNRQRALNPAYEPRYTEDAVRKTAEMLDTFTSWWHSGMYDERPIRDIGVFRFFQALEDVSLSGDFSDVSPLTELPRLRKLKLMTRSCEDYSPLARCEHLTELGLTMWRSYMKPTTLWPNLRGLEKLQALESLALEGNLLAFPRDISWPKVRAASLICCPLDARNVHDLPQLPACETLTLSGVERLDGIEAFPRLRNLTIDSVVRDFTPLIALQELTWLLDKEFEPLDVAPLARVPKLRFIGFDTESKHRLVPVRPRDFSPLAEAPQLRELQVKGCPPVMTEVAALNAALLPWNEVVLRSEPRPLPPLHIVVAPWAEMDKRKWNVKQPDPDMDPGLRDCEGRWVSRFATRFVGQSIGNRDWGEASADGKSRHVTFTIHSFDVVEKLPQILDAARKAIASLEAEYDGTIWIQLKATRRQPTPAEKELLEKFQNEQDEADFERRQREMQAYLERLHRYELKKQEGQQIKPEEFAPAPQEPLPPAPWERDDEEDDDDDEFDDSGDVVVKKKKPDPPPSPYDDDEHPLADKYNLMGRFDLSQVWFPIHSHGLVSYLMNREPDEVIPEPPKQ